MFSIRPLVMSSTTRIFDTPFSTSRSIRCDPMNDAPPVTNTRFSRQFISIRSSWILLANARFIGLRAGSAVSNTFRVRKSRRPDGGLALAGGPDDRRVELDRHRPAEQLNQDP